MREILGARNSYSVMPPSGLAPEAREIHALTSGRIHAEALSPIQKKQLGREKTDPVTHEQTLRGRMFKFDKEYVEMANLLVIADP